MNTENSTVSETITVSKNDLKTIIDEKMNRNKNNDSKLNILVFRFFMF